MKYDVFISYSRKDAKIIDYVEQELNKLSISCFIDRTEISLGADWSKKITQAISESEILLFIWSDNSNQSDNAADEIGLALDLQKTIVPFKIGTFQPSDFLRLRLVRFNRIDVLELNKKEIDGLIIKISSMLGKSDSIDSLVASNIKSFSSIVVDEEEAKEMYLFAQNYDDANKFKEAAKYYEKAANKGNADAMTRLGEMYENGIGIEMDKVKAFELYTNASKKGNNKATALLGYMYHEGIVVEQDDFQTYRLVKKSAEAKDAYGLASLGMLYMDGIGVPPNTSKAKELLEQAASMGESDAFGLLAMLGFGFVDSECKDIDKAKLYLQKAIDLDNVNALSLYSRMLADGFVYEQDYEKAYQVAQKAAELGDADAKAYLGSMYIDGLGVSKDIHEGVKYLIKSVEQGSAEGIQNLAVCYYTGTGVKQDYLKALEILEKGCRMKNKDCIIFTAKFYRDGNGIEVNYERAIELYKEAIELGNARAYALLGEMYENGWGVDTDPFKAFMYYKDGAKREDSLSFCYLGNAYQFGIGTEINLNLAFENYTKAADLGDIDAKNKLAIMYDKGAPCPQDQEKAIVLWEECADEGNVWGLYNLADYYGRFDDNNIPIDIVKCIDYYTRAAELNHSESMVILGNLYLSGEYVDKNDVKAFEWFEKAAALNDSNGLFSLGYLYEEGIGAKKDIAQALDLYLKAADMNHADAQNRAGVLYSNSEYPFCDEKKAYESYVRAAVNGQSYGMYNLGVSLIDGSGCTQDEEKGIDWLRKSAEAGCALAIEYLENAGLQPVPEKLIPFENEYIDEIALETDGRSKLFVCVKMSNNTNSSFPGRIYVEVDGQNNIKDTKYDSESGLWIATVRSLDLDGTSATGEITRHNITINVLERNSIVFSQILFVKLKHEFNFFSKNKFELIAYKLK